MAFVKWFLITFLTLTFHNTMAHAQQSKKFFRKDYKYIEATQSFYKIHTLAKTWQDAIERCEMEGASLFYATDKVEADAVVEYWHQTQPPHVWMYVGISDLLADELYSTIDGHLLTDVYENWATGEPSGGSEHCVQMNQAAAFNDVDCNSKFPFICKKKLNTVEWNEDCNVPDKGYVRSQETQRCYKFHHQHPKTWTKAAATCMAEQSYLAVINCQAEANYLVDWTSQMSDIKFGKNNMSIRGGIIYLGFHNRDGRGWKTLKGTSLEDSGYAKWGSHQPDGGIGEHCGTMSSYGELHDVVCSDKHFFICEHEMSMAPLIMGAQRVNA